MKTAISIPDEVFKHAERVAKRLGVSRSELFTRAMREYLGASRDSTITASYDSAFSESDDKADDKSDDKAGDELVSFRREATRKALLGVEWTEK